MVTLRKNFFVFTMNIMISVIILLGTFIIPVHAAGYTTVKVNPLSQTISSGNTFTISIACVPAQAIKSFELKVVFNPSLLKANSVSQGNIFKSYTTFFNAGTIDNVGGTIKNIYDLILGTGSVSSSGTLVTISFTAKSTPGTSSINLNTVGITNNVGYLPITITNGSVQISAQTPPSSTPPVYEYMSPANKSTNIPISTTSLSLTIRDPDSDHFNYTIQTHPNVGSVSLHGAHNGTKQCTISGLKYSTTYRWYVNATDGVNWKRRWYTFTTAQNSASNPFIISGANPSNGATNIPISTSKITLTVQNTKGHAFNMNIITSPDIGSSSRMNALNGSKAVSISGLTYSTTYHWYVSCEDVSNGLWTNQSYWFATESNPAGGNPPSGGGTSSNETEPPSIPEQNNPPNPPAKPTGPTFIEPGVEYYYICIAFDSDNDTIRLRFDWGDGTYSDWTGFLPSNVTASLSHTWMNVTSFNISVIAQDEHGQNSSWSDALTVTISQAETEEEPAIVEIIASSDNISTNENIQFDASSCYVPGSTIISYHWEFGDGKTSTGKKTSYSYTAPGQYAVTLTITDSQGETYYNKTIVSVATGAEVIAQNTMNFLSIIITSGLIGIVIILVMILILLTRGTVLLQLGKKYLASISKWIKPHTTKRVEVKHSKSIKPEPKQTITPHVNEDKTINTSLHYTLTEDYEQNLDGTLLQKIHERIDRL
jgi:chitodextrinase